MSEECAQMMNDINRPLLEEELSQSNLDIIVAEVMSPKDLVKLSMVIASRIRMFGSRPIDIEVDVTSIKDWMTVRVANYYKGFVSVWTEKGKVVGVSKTGYFPYWRDKNTNNDYQGLINLCEMISEAWVLATKD